MKYAANVIGVHYTTISRTVGWFCESGRTVNFANWAGEGLRLQRTSDICGWVFCETN